MTAPTESETSGDEGPDWVGVISVVLLSVTAILTAWSGFQATKWGGQMSISFAQASTARLEAAALSASADRRMSLQVDVFAQYLQARESGDDAAARAISSRFKEPLATAFDAWLQTKPFQNTDAPESPFEMPEYVLPERAEAAAISERADALFSKGLDDNQRGDYYTVLVVLGAVILFFSAMSTRVARPVFQWILLGTALVLFVGMVAIMIVLPKQFF